MPFFALGSICPVQADWIPPGRIKPLYCKGNCCCRRPARRSGSGSGSRNGSGSRSGSGSVSGGGSSGGGGRGSGSSRHVVVQQ